MSERSVVVTATGESESAVVKVAVVEGLLGSNLMDDTVVILMANGPEGTVGEATVGVCSCGCNPMEENPVVVTVTGSENSVVVRTTGSESVVANFVAVVGLRLCGKGRVGADIA